MKKSKIIIESGISKSEKMKIVKVMRNNSFLNYRDDLEKHGMKVEFSTSPFSHYRITHRKWGKRKDGKESSIFITSKRNVGDDAEYISNDNIAMGELTEIVQETMFNKMKANDQLTELTTEVVQEMISETGKWDQATANKKADLSKIRTKTMMDLYMVMKNNPKTKKEKDAVQKLFDELKKRGELKHIKSPMDESDEVNEEMHDCIQDYMGMGHSYSEAMKKCKGSVWDEKGGKSGKRGKRMRREDISEDDGANINVHALTNAEIQLAVGAINFFGTGSHPMADAKGLKYFKVDYLADIIAKNKNKLASDAKKHLANLLKKLQKSTNEETISEGDDLRFVIDQLANSMEHYDEKEFVDHMSKETNYDANKLKKVFNAYWDLGAMDRFKLETDINKTKKFLAKLGIK